MARHFVQLRYYGETTTGVPDTRNYPSNLTMNKLKNGQCFLNYLPCQSLQINGTPGIMFYLNDTGKGIKIGNTEIYNLDDYEIDTISFEKGINGGSVKEEGLATIFSEEALAQSTPYLFINLFYEE